MTSRRLANPDVLNRLVAVVRTRLTSAERALQVELLGLSKIELEIVERQGKVDKFCQDLQDLQQFFAGDSTHGVGTVDSADYQLGLKQRYWIIYDLQRERYYLDMTHDEHKVQLEKIVEVRKTFKAQKFKHDTLVEELRCATRLRVDARTRKEEAERQDLVRYSAR